MGPYTFLYVLMDFDGSLGVSLNFFAPLWILMDPYVSL